MNIILNSQQCITDLTCEEREKLKEALTYNNPAYEQAKKFGKCKYTTIPPYLTYFEATSFENKFGEREPALKVPVGVDVRKILNKKPNSVKDIRTNEKIKFPKFLLTLREDQEKAKSAYLENNKSTFGKGLVQLPTGKGKSILALNLAYTLKAKTLILVHKDDLVVGWKNDIKLCFGDDIEIGLIKAKSRKVGPQITIATVQTLGKMELHELNNYLNQFTFVVQDECHHIGLKMFNIINQFNSRYKLGLSATPTRTDNLNFVFDLFLGGMCYKHEYDINDKDILPVKVEFRHSPAKYLPFVYEGEVFNFYDFDLGDLPYDLKLLQDLDYEERPTIPHLTLDDTVVKSREHKIYVCKDIIKEYRAGHSCLVMFTQKSHIDQYYSYLKRYIPKDQIILYYGDSKEKSDVMMDRAENRKSLVTLATYAKATEGTNVKAWEIEFLASPIKNEKNLEQAVGRIRRSKDNKLTPVILYDYDCEKVYSLNKYINVRKKVYKRLKFDTGDTKFIRRGMFSRGYNK